MTEPRHARESFHPKYVSWGFSPNALCTLRKVFFSDVGQIPLDHTLLKDRLCLSLLNPQALAPGSFSITMHGRVNLLPDYT